MAHIDQPCEQCSLIYSQIFDMHNTFQEIIIDERGFTDDFNELFYKRSLMNLDVSHTGTFFIKRFRDKTTSCQNLILICSPRNIFSKFLSVLLRIYLNSFFLFSELNLPSSQLSFLQTRNMVNLF